MKRNDSENRIRLLEDIVIKIANDVSWLKKMGYIVIGSPFVTEVIRHLWK